MSEYLEKQKEEEARHQRTIEKEQRKIWTPESILERCCLPWLAHGPHQMIRSGGNLASVSSRGCSGCLKEHPKITLNFEGGVATASISHALDPFLDFFGEMPQSTETQPLKYHLSGPLSNHHERIKQKFGKHLVLVEHKALASSQRAYEKQLEQDDMEQAAKKRKVLGKAAPINLLETILEICYNHSLCDHLDVAEIAWLRTSCKSMGRIAAWMARERMRSIKFSFDAISQKCSITQGLEYSPQSILRPSEPQASITWSDHDGDDSAPVEITIHLEEVATPERSILFKYPGRLEVARYLLHMQRFGEDGVYRAKSQVQNQNDMEGSLEFRVHTPSSEQRGIRVCGEINLQSIAFTFNDFLGVYVRKRLYKAKQKYHSSAIKKPAEKAYIKALAKAAREAPGNADSFRGLKGWNDVYS